MSNFPKKIEQCFGSEHAPNRNELVALNGLDELEKFEALKNFGGKSWTVVYRHLVEGEPGWNNVRLEEWSVLEPGALRYFLRPYLLYALDTLIQPRPDDEFLSHLYFQLSEVLRVRGNTVFERRQTEVLTEIAGAVLMTIETDPRFDIWRNDIRENVTRCLALLNAT